MGTTLTGTTPQDTYDSLIKVTDNGPLSGTAKYLSDGLGNDSILALSTSKVGVGTTNPNSKLDVVQTSEAEALRVDGSGAGFAFVVNGGTSYKSAIRNASIGSGYFSTAAPTDGLIVAGNVGIGTSSPSSAYKLTVNSGSNINSFLNGDKIAFSRTSDNAAIAYLSRTNDLGANGTANIHGYDGIQFRTEGPESVKATITSAGVLELAQGQIKFPATQVPSADANTLDDYEEGTWTMGIAFGGASTGVTYSANSGKYTKIGRQVTINGLLIVSDKGSSTGDFTITGLPFTIPNSFENQTAASLRLNGVSFANQYQGNGVINTTTMAFSEITEGGVVSNLTNAEVANGASFIVSLTYFV